MNDIKKNPLLFKALSQHKFNQKLKKSIYKNVNKKGKRKKNDIESVPFSGQVISLNNEVIQKLDINLENFLTMKVVGNKSTLVGIQLNYKENNIPFLRFNYKQSENDIEDLLLKQLKKLKLI